MADELEEPKEKTSDIAADAAKETAQASHDMTKMLSERLDLLHQDIGSNFGRVHERLDRVETELAKKAEVSEVPEEGKEETVKAAELIVEPVKDVAVKKEKKSRGSKGRRRR